jgi:hypothetical protein
LPAELAFFIGTATSESNVPDDPENIALIPERYSFEAHGGAGVFEPYWDAV